MNINFLRNDSEDILVVSKTHGFEILNISNLNNIVLLCDIVINLNDEVARAAVSYDKRFIFLPVFIGHTGYYVYDI